MPLAIKHLSVFSLAELSGYDTPDVRNPVPWMI